MRKDILRKFCGESRQKQLEPGVLRKLIHKQTEKTARIVKLLNKNYPTTGK